MDVRLSVKTYTSKYIKGAHSLEGELSDLFTIFHSDSETEYDPLDVSPQQPCNDDLSPSPLPSSSASRLGHVTISSPSNGTKRGPSFTDTDTPGAIISKDKKRRISPLSTSSLYSSPSDNDDEASLQNPSSISLDLPQETAYVRVPEPTTPRTEQFISDMRAMLSLIPPERYSSPEPSPSEDQLRETETGEHDPDVCGVSPVLLVHAATGDCSSGNRSLVPSPDLLPSFPID
ncbi:hypothetical protein F4825DRAFT_452438 [Nemania diffusa]|nr:hypothetical protein F4825DRAFT_452438 [Nemania diffusa]